MTSAARRAPPVIVTDNGPACKSADFARFIGGRTELSHVRTGHYSVRVRV
jgi:hypothetical protein